MYRKWFKNVQQDYLTQISSGKLTQDIANFHTPSLTASVVSINPEIMIYKRYYPGNMQGYDKATGKSITC